MSATRTDTFGKCRRKWAFEYIARVPYPPSPWLAFGTLFHAHLERYFTDGSLPDLSWLVKVLNGKYVPTDDEVAGKLAAASLPEWPKFAPGRFAPERPFRYEMPHGIFTGTVDLPDLWIKQIGDHKTTVSLKWAPTVDELLKWPQPVCYSYHTARELEWKENDCKWVYSEKGSGLRKVVQTPKMPFSYWEDMWEGTYVPLTKEMAELYAQGADPMELSPAEDTSYCDAYGGCPFKALCVDVNTSLLGGWDDGDSTMSELDALLGTAPEVTQEVGETITTEAPAELSALDDLLNPPAAGAAPVESKAPALADPKPTPETEAKAAADAANKPAKKPRTTKPKSSAPPDATPEGAAALESLKAMRTEPEAPVAEAPKEVAPIPTLAPEPDETPIQHAANVSQAIHDIAPGLNPAAELVAMDALAQAAALLVGIYLQPQTALGASGPACISAVNGLAAQGHTDNALIIRAIPVILTLRKAFGDQ